MRINLRIKYAGQDKDKAVLCTASDLVAFEEKYNRSVAKLEAEFKLTDLMFLAWRSESRNKATKSDFMAWVDEIESIEVEDKDPK